MESATDAQLLAMPPPPAKRAGCNVLTGHNYRIAVSNKPGFLCHIHVQFTVKGASPDVPFAILTHPENCALLRDLKRVGERKILRAEPGLKELQINSYTKVRELWMLHMYSTWLHVVEDSRDPECLFTTFDLINSEYFLKFNGRWELRPVRDPATGLIVGCRGELSQDVLLKSVPIFVTRLPLIGSKVRKVCMRAIKRLIEDLSSGVDQVLAGHAAGKSTEEVLQELCKPEERSESGAGDKRPGGGLVVAHPLVEEAVSGGDRGCEAAVDVD